MKIKFSILPFASLLYVVYMVVLVNSCKKEAISPLLQVSTVAGSGIPGFSDGVGIAAQFALPTGVAVDSKGNVYIADYDNHRIRKMTPSGLVSTLAGNGTIGFAEGVGSGARFKNPSGISVDALGNVYVADQGNHRIRKITPAGLVSTLAGNGKSGFSDGHGASAQFAYPTGVAVDSKGNVYVADRDNHRIRKVTAEGLVSTLAGNGEAGYAEGTGTPALLNAPNGVAVDAGGTVYVAEFMGNRIRKISSEGIVSTLAGNGVPGYNDGIGTAALFNHPAGIEIDVIGNVYVADAGNSCIRLINTKGEVSTLAGTGEADFTDNQGILAQFNFPSEVALGPSGNLYVADANNRRIRRINLR